MKILNYIFFQCFSCGKFFPKYETRYDIKILREGICSKCLIMKRLENIRIGIYRKTRFFDRIFEGELKYSVSIFCANICVILITLGYIWLLIILISGL